MKKYIIIAGVPRAGKSTASQMIAKETGFQHISMDSVIAGIEKVFPETKIDTDSNDEPQKNIEFISSKIAPFIRAMMDSGEYDECDYGVVIDVFQLLPKDYIDFVKNEKCEIYYFLSSDVTPDERFKILKLHDTPKDYTYYHSDEENIKDCTDIVNISELMKQQCIICGLPYYETSYNRENVLNDFMSCLKMV
ncbi:MAG: hypothetical protein IJZ72_01020 [Oscillospiraceae bacterium]|nr:hypothetical protein [Oscillospiraceae bacterium]